MPLFTSGGLGFVILVLVFVLLFGLGLGLGLKNLVLFTSLAVEDWKEWLPVGPGRPRKW